MSINPPEESREQRAELTKQAIADIVRARILERRLRQTTVADKSGISRSYLRALFRAEKQLSLFIFLELSDALGFEDACQLLRCVLECRDQLQCNDVQERESRKPTRHLQEEIEAYIRHLPEQLRQQGKFVVIKGAEVAGIFDSYRDAVTAGYQRFKLDPFSVKRIAAVKRVDILSRMSR